MQFIVTIMVIGLIVSVPAAAAGGPADATPTPLEEHMDLKPGDEAPTWRLPGSDGKTYALADFRGKRTVVLAWFPKAFTGG